MAAAAPAAPPKPAAPAPSVDPTLAYYRNVRQMNIQLAKDRYKQGFKVRTQEFIRGRGTLAILDEEICMGCTHCFDNCAFEAIDMLERKFSLPEYSYTSRKAQIIVENCVGCEKCAIVCPVDAITMVPQEGYEMKDGRLTQVAGARVPDMPPFYQPPKPGQPRPPETAGKFEPKSDTDRVTHRISAAFKPAPAKPATPVPVAKPATTPPATPSTTAIPQPKPASAPPPPPSPPPTAPQAVPPAAPKPTPPPAETAPPAPPPESQVTATPPSPSPPKPAPKKKKDEAK